ncbi:MAG: hypothetical protein KHW86_17205 [Porphyromonadaceae bacterium]|jgi:hypothetical protein|nr:hypothetical protein [Porphyromonadaceae bacterium]
MLGDPLLEDRNYYLPEIEKKQQEYLKKVQELRQQGTVSNQTPIWAEIDSVLSGLSEEEFKQVNSMQEFQESSLVINTILNRECMKIVESTPDGREALDKHLKIIKKLRKTIADEVNKKYSLFAEYMEKYSDMTWGDFVNMKKEKGKKK